MRASRAADLEHRTACNKNHDGRIAQQYEFKGGTRERITQDTGAGGRTKERMAGAKQSSNSGRTSAHRWRLGNHINCNKGDCSEQQQRK